MEELTAFAILIGLASWTRTGELAATSQETIRARLSLGTGPRDYTRSLKNIPPSEGMLYDLGSSSESDKRADKLNAATMLLKFLSCRFKENDLGKPDFAGGDQSPSVSGHRLRRV
jgi:hypothetical protein